ncbi:MAG: EndoU domain-containing protein [Cystobacter sp.]
MISTVALLALAGCKTAPQTRPEPDEPSAEDAEQVQLMEMAAGSAGSHPCTDASWHWSSTSPKVNRLHVFCGEIGSNKSPKGFHSIVHQKASSVVTGVGKKKNNHNGIYDADVSFAAPATPSTKMSTFFPDTCSEDQITESILYAANNQTGPHSAWGVLGPSAPKTGGHQYCLDSKGKPFTIRMGLTRSDVNTAFPN